MTGAAELLPTTPIGTDFPRALPVKPVSRRPLRLPAETIAHVRSRLVPSTKRPAPRHPTASVVMVTYGNLPLSRMALESVLANTTAPDYELIVVDNGSSDGTAEYVGVLSTRNAHVRAVHNARNRGFAAACNQGLRFARGEVLVLLNNDTLVAPGWLSGLETHLRDEAVGLVGPVTNRCGNEAEVEASYERYGGLLALAAQRQAFAAPLFDIPVAEMFCVAMRREVFAAVGPLDERFEVGLFEDDDYSRRIRERGLRVACAQDVFVHHFGEGSFGRLVPSGRYAEVFESNRVRFEQKWGVRWQPHGRRPDPGYERVRAGVADAVGRRIPPESVVLVVSRGDDALLDFPGSEGWHFPRMPDGTYAGHYPADDAEAVRQLEHQAKLGAQYLVIPAPSLWWLDHYRGFLNHLNDHHREVESIPGVGTVFALAGSPRPGHATESVVVP